MDTVSGASATFYRYRLPLRRPLPLRHETLHERSGVLVRLTTSSGTAGWGEIAPLPGFSNETPDEALFQALEVASVLVRRNLDDIDPRLSGLRRQELYHPSVRFGMESALLSIQAAHAGTYPARLLTDSDIERVSVNGLLIGVGAQVVNEAVAMAERGYVALKLKVGRAPIREEAATVRTLRAELPGAVAIRLDANRAWDFDDAREFIAAAGPESITYIEEPLNEPGRLAKLASVTGAAYAVDETLQQIGWRVVTSIRERGTNALDGFSAYSDAHLTDAALHASAWVVKPTLFGAPLEFYTASAPCHGYDGPLVISSAFESGLGLVMLANLAAVANSGRIPAGLDTQRWFEADTLEEDLLDVDGTCELQRAWSLASRPSLNLLEEIAHV